MKTEPYTPSELKEHLHSLFKANTATVDGVKINTELLHEVIEELSEAWVDAYCAERELSACEKLVSHILLARLMRKKK